MTDHILYGVIDSTVWGNRFGNTVDLS